MPVGCPVPIVHVLAYASGGKHASPYGCVSVLQCGTDAGRWAFCAVSPCHKLLGVPPQGKRATWRTLLRIVVCTLVHQTEVGRASACVR